MGASELGVRAWQAALAPPCESFWWPAQCKGAMRCLVQASQGKAMEGAARH